MSSVDSVVQFCPRCGAKAKAPVETFVSPQACPNCKTKVLFWDVTKEPAGEIVEAINLKPILSLNQILIAVAVSVSIILITLMLLVTDFVGVSFFVAALMLFAGGFGIAVFLAEQYKIAKQSEQLNQLLNTLEKAREQQIGISIKYTSLQDNFQQLVASANREANDAKTDYLAKAGTIESDFAAKSKSLEEDYKLKFNTVKSDCENKLNTSLRDIAQREFTATATVRSIAIKYLDETKKILIAKLTADNLTQTQERFQKVVEFVKKVGFPVAQQDIDQFVDDIKKEYATELRRQLAREEQARIKEKLRDEAKAEADYQREMKRIEQETKLYERLLSEARSKASTESTSQILELERKLAEAQENQRSLSMAQQTKAGRVYVISNIGSFGEGVFKIGMTRRLEFMDRIKELGDASVPFPFDVHMMIACDNAPGFENELHKRFNQHRINKVNFRKEFFRVGIDDIKMAVEELHGEVEYVVDPEAIEYRESLTMTDEQFEMVTNISHEVGMDDEDDDAS